MPAVVGATAAEGGAHERRELLDGGGQDEDVARLEGRVVSEQLREHVPQHLDLAGAAVARVDLD